MAATVIKVSPIDDKQRQAGSDTRRYLLEESEVSC